jgi:hypothetical protein
MKLCYAFTLYVIRFFAVVVRFIQNFYVRKGYFIDLGYYMDFILLDTKLNFQNHVNQACNRAKKILIALRKKLFKTWNLPVAESRYGRPDYTYPK